MYTSEGLASFYSGLTPALLGLTHVAVQFPTYEYLKTTFTGQGMGEAPAHGEKAHWLGILSASILSKILASGAIPTVDTWTFTAAGTPWFDQQWGAQVLLRTVEVAGSWTGLVLLRAALTAAVVGCVFLMAHRRGLDTRRAAVLGLLAFIVAAPAMALRPQLLGMACFALTLLAVSERRRVPRAVWIVPVVTVIWANLHGSFFLAPLVLGLTWVDDVQAGRPTARSTLAAGALSALAACLTPFGPAVWGYVAGLSSNPEVTAQVTEWQPTSVQDAPGILFFGSALVVAVFLARRGRRAPWSILLWLGVFLAIGAYAQRGIAWWPFAAVAATEPWISAIPLSEAAIAT